MKKLFALVLFSSFVLASSQDLERFRKLMQQAEHSDSASKTLFEDSRRSYDSSRKPIALAFFALGNFLMAKHSTNPITQYYYFSKGQKALEEAVRKDPKNLEIRFIRFMSQDQAPAVLGYRSNLAADRKFILSEMKRSSDADLIRKIKSYFKM